MLGDGQGPPSRGDPEAREAGGRDPLTEVLEAKVAVASQSTDNATARITLPAGNVSDVPLSKTAAGWLISGQGQCVPVPRTVCPSGA
jgi:hypothetical protein